MQRVKTFWSEPIAKAEESIRRFTFSTDSSSGSWRGKPCPGTSGGHDASTNLGVVDYPLPEGCYEKAVPDNIPHDDPRWPTKCEHCDYVFTDEDQWQHNYDRCYQEVGGSRVFTLRKAVPGAMYDACWLHDIFPGPDGMSLTVILPDLSDWHVDARANNCTKPNENTHHCWVRHGDPRKAEVTVDKRGNTCNAGAGSIATPKYRGFLRNGWLERC